MVEFLAEARGLCQVEIKYLYPRGVDPKLKQNKSELTERFLDYFYGPQDYAIIGYKA
jgi:O-antigen chain-terminating methyltransferase